MKNKIYKVFVLALMFAFVTACDKGFDELNTNEFDATSLDPAFILNRAIVNSTSSTLIYETALVQWIVTPFTGVLGGGNFNTDNKSAVDDNWDNYFDVIQHTRDVIAIASEDPNRANLVSMGRIIQAWAFMVLTDTYGAVPYDEGGNGYYSQVYFPEYQSQEYIYGQIITEVQEATNVLSTSGKIETADILYGGDIAQWKKFGNSLLLRIGMRLSKVDATRAASIVGSAFSGGVITSNEDNAMIPATSDYKNPAGNTLSGNESANYYLTKTLVDWLKDMNDPRLAAFSVRFVGARSGNDQKDAIKSTTPEVQIGMPMGYDNGSIDARAKADGLVGMYDYSQASRKTLANQFAPYFIITAGQTNLLLAEARQRGWITSGTAAQYFADGVRQTLEQIALYDESVAIAENDIKAYVAAHPLNAGTELEQINSQYWISSIMNGEEGWANFRRSGFPDLAPNPFPGREVVWVYRLTYPNGEASVNKENLDAALAVQGPDKLDVKLWWDK